MTYFFSCPNDKIITKYGPEGFKVCEELDNKAVQYLLVGLGTRLLYTG